MSYSDLLNFDKYCASSYDTALEQIEVTEKQLTKIGIRISSNSRLVKYRRTIHDLIRVARDKAAVAHPDLNLLHQALYEFDQLAMIVEQLATTSVDTRLMTRLQELVSGHDLPSTEAAHTPARDAQFELYVAACCVKSGLKVYIAEPDLLIDFRGKRIAVAAKRPKSISKLESHIRKARKQIVGSGQDGIVALDMSHIHNVPNFAFEVATKEEAVQAVREVADSFVDRNSARLFHLARAPQIFGLMVCVRTRFLITEIPQLSSSTRWTFANLCASSDSRYNVIRELAGIFSRAYDSESI